MSSLNSRVRGNEVISATLIEIMLVLAFVLLIVLATSEANVLESPETQGDLQSICENLKELARGMNQNAIANQMDCSQEDIDASEAFAKWKDILVQIREGGIPGLPPDTTPAELVERLEKTIANLYDQIRGLYEELSEKEETILGLNREIVDLKIMLEEVSFEIESLKDDIRRLEEEAGGFSSAAEDTKKRARQNRELERKLELANAEIERLEKEIAGNSPGPGDGTQPGSCMGDLMANGKLSGDHLIEADYSTDRLRVRLRQDGKHFRIIQGLIDQDLLPQRLTYGSPNFVVFSEEDFLREFKPQLDYAKKQIPPCRFYVTMIMDGDLPDRENQPKKKILNDRFYTDELRYRQ